VTCGETIKVPLAEKVERFEIQSTEKCRSESFLLGPKEYGLSPNWKAPVPILEYCSEGLKKNWDDCKRKPLENNSTKSSIASALLSDMNNLGGDWRAAAFIEPSFRQLRAMTVLVNRLLGGSFIGTAHVEYSSAREDCESEDRHKVKIAT